MHWGKEWPDMTSERLDEWFWTMFEPTWTWIDFIFGQLFIWIGVNNDQIWLPRGYMSEFEHFLNRLQLDLILPLVNVVYELGQIMTRYVFVEVDVWVWAMFEQTSIWPNFIFGHFSVARKPIINGGAIRPKGLLFCHTIVGYCVIFLSLLWMSITYIYVI